MPGIVLMDTTPTLHKIQATADLVRHVHHGTYPAEPSVVTMHVPVVARPLRRYSEGMKLLDNRRVVLCCYEAFRSIAGI